MLDSELMEQMIKDGFVKRQIHPRLPLAILNYTPKAVYSKTWNDVTLWSRGLIYNIDTDEVVSRSFRKFFNWSEPEVGRLPAGAAIIAPKMDGSLGVLYFHDEIGGAIATRGSFTSPQSQVGTQLLHEIIEWANFQPLPDKTYLFEIIYPENRIVVDYGPERRLVLLDVIDTESGQSDIGEFDSCEWPDKVARSVVHLGDHDGDAMHALLDQVPEDEEGLVFYFPSTDTRLKLKKAEYVRLHRIVTGVSTKTIWQTLASRGDFEELLDRVPDEFYSWVKKTVAEFEYAYRTTEHELFADYTNVRAGLPLDFTRKDFALYVNKHYRHKQAFMFAQLDGRDLHDLIWASLKPVYEKPFAQISEDNN